MSTTLTIFTPTYNRGYILPKLYESLCQQTSNDFVWLVIDDGSTDNTKVLFDKWVQEDYIKINYVYQDNAGKMFAHNRAVMMAETELFMCVDSDDLLSSPTAIEDNLKFWTLQKSQNFYGIISLEKVSGVISYKRICGMSSNKNPLYNNKQFPASLYCSSLMGLYESGFSGDTTLMFITEVLKKYPFPEIEGEKFIPESISYDKIDQKYKLILFPYYSQLCEYRSDGYTQNMLSWILKYPRGMRMSYNQNVELKKNTRIKDEIRYIALSLLIGDGTTVSASSNKFLTLLLFPLGVVLYAKYKRMQNKLI